MQTQIMVEPIPSAAIFWYGRTRPPIRIPTDVVKCVVEKSRLPSTREYWEDLLSNPYYSVKLREHEIIEHLDILHRFSSRLLDKSREIEPEIARIINENFWDLF